MTKRARQVRWRRRPRAPPVRRPAQPTRCVLLDDHRGARHRLAVGAVDQREVADTPRWRLGGAAGVPAAEQLDRAAPARQRAAAAAPEPSYVVFVRASSRIRFARDRIEHTAGAETRERGRRLVRRPPVLLDEVDHLLRQRVADHAVPAHGREHHHLRVRHLLGLAFEAQRVADAVAWNARVLAAVLGAVDRRGDVDAQAEVLFLDALDELSRPRPGCRTPRRTS